MKRKLRFGAFEQRVAFLCVVLFGAFGLLFVRLPAHLAAMEKQHKYEGEFYEFAQLFSEIYRDVSERYVEEVDSKQLFEGAIRGMFATLDPHSQWLSPDSLTNLEKETEGEFSGVGLHITLRDGVLTIIAPIPGTPAARAGLLPMDRIVEIDDETTDEITLTEAVKRLTGPDGTPVDVKVFREGEDELLEFTLVRDKIKIESVFWRVLEEDIAYLRIERFADDTATDVKRALKEFNKLDLEGMIVDLRYDTGGLLDKVVEICDYFMPVDQIIVSTKGRRESSNREYFSEKEPLTELPLVVLVNRGSASASEIFAGAMQDTKRGIIMGPEDENTFGKGSVQTITYLRHSLDKGENGEARLSGMRLTTAKYYTPSGRTIHNIGITPDVEVPLTRDQRRALLRHGLIGDPDQSAFLASEEKKAAEAKREEEAKAAEEAGEDSESPESASADDSEDSESAEGDAAEAEAEPEEFHDVELEHALNYLHDTLIPESRG